MRFIINCGFHIILQAMGFRSVLAKPFAAYIASQTKIWSSEPLAFQQKIFKSLIKTGEATSFGKDHNFSSIRNYEDFKKNVPVREYEDLKNYIDQVVKGKADILWKGKPAYFAKTSGTTSGTKYIPITSDLIAKASGITREALYRALRPDAQPRFDTISRVCAALGVKLVAQAVHV